VNVDLLEWTEFTGESNNVFERNADGQYNRRHPLRRLLGLVSIRVTERMHEQRDRNNHGERYNRSTHYVSAL
jgi:hypothetical protein